MKIPEVSSTYSPKICFKSSVFAGRLSAASVMEIDEKEASESEQRPYLYELVLTFALI